MFRQLIFEQTCNDYTFNYTQIIIRELFVVVACNEPPPLQEMPGCRNHVGSSCGFQNYIRLDLLLLAKEHGEARQYSELTSFSTNVQRLVP